MNPVSTASASSSTAAIAANAYAASASTGPQKLLGKVALVTGGSRGMGAAIARRLASDGAAIAITYSSASSQKADEVVASIVAAGGRAIAIRADSSDAAAVKNSVDETVNQLGRIDILVNNAGVLTIKPIAEFTLEEFDRTIDVNVRAIFVASQAAAARMTEGGRIINIGSVNADSMPFAGGSVYAMSKGAVSSFTRGLARDLGPRGITVNNVQPGPVDTDMNPENSAFAAGLKAMMALGRYGRADEIAAFVSYLASPEGGYATGASYTLDGGFAA